MALSVNELQIGDWVSLRNKSYKIGALSSQCVILKGYKPSGLLIDCNDIDPISLTAKILEKNGWKRHNVAYLKWWELNIGSLHIERDGLDIKIWIDYDEGGYYADYLLPSPKYVHELQRALRLCELNDLADDFKV